MKKKCKEINAKIDAVYRESSPSMTTINISSTNLNVVVCLDGERPVCQEDVVTNQIVEKVHDMILTDCQTKVREIAEAVSVLYGTTINILHDELSVRKLSARWVLRLFTVDNKLISLSMPQHCLDLLVKFAGFLRGVVTVDETWIHYYMPDIKRQSKQCIFQVNLLPSVRKVMAPIFWEPKSIILIHFFD